MVQEKAEEKGKHAVVVVVVSERERKNIIANIFQVYIEKSLAMQ